MKTLAELLDDYKVVNSVGEHVGKIKDVFLDLNKWAISGFEVSPRIFKKAVLLRIEDVVEFKEKEKFVIVKDDFQGSEIPSTPMKNMFPFDELRKDMW